MHSRLSFRQNAECLDDSFIGIRQSAFDALTNKKLTDSTPRLATVPPHNNAEARANKGHHEVVQVPIMLMRSGITCRTTRSALAGQRSPTDATHFMFNRAPSQD